MEIMVGSFCCFGNGGINYYCISIVGNIFIDVFISNDVFIGNDRYVMICFL